MGAFIKFLIAFQLFGFFALEASVCEYLEYCQQAGADADQFASRLGISPTNLHSCQVPAPHLFKRVMGMTV